MRPKEALQARLNVYTICVMDTVRSIESRFESSRPGLDFEDATTWIPVDPEQYRAIGDIASLLRAHGWNVQRVEALDRGVHELGRLGLKVAVPERVVEEMTQAFANQRERWREGEPSRRGCSNAAATRRSGPSSPSEPTKVSSRGGSASR